VPHQLKRTQLLLMTATVRPQTCLSVVLRDPVRREEEYRNSLRWWAGALRGSRREILLVENSGHDWTDFVEEVSEISGTQIHQYSYSESSDLRNGKGVGEAIMYSHVARWLSDHGGATTDLLKITGRLRLNWSRSVPNPPDCTQYVMGRFSQNFGRMDTRMFMVDAGTFCRFFSRLENDVDEHQGRYLEDAARNAAFRAFLAGADRVSFTHPPAFRGCSGSTGARYRGYRVSGASLLRSLASRMDTYV
jgi:hypothetical protein